MLLFRLAPPELLSPFLTRSHRKNTLQARLCELGERENAGRKRAQVYPLRYSEHVFSRRRRDLVAQRAAAQGVFEMASSYRDDGFAVSKSDTGLLEKSRPVFGAIGSNTR